MKLKRLLIAGAAALLIYLAYQLLRGPEGRLKLPAGAGVPLVSLGDSHGVVLAPDGSLWSWGGEDHGWPVLGLGKRNFTPNLVPVPHVHTSPSRIAAGANPIPRARSMKRSSPSSVSAGLRYDADAVSEVGVAVLLIETRTIGWH